MPDSLRLAVGTLTALRVPAPLRVDRAVAGRAMLVAPLTMVPVLLALGGWAWLVVALEAPPLLGAAVSLVVLTLATRGIHLDGLSDTADGLSAGYDRQRSLTVMHRSDIGPSGVAATTLVLLVDVAALAVLHQSWAGLALAGCCLLWSRHLLAWACLRRLPAARQDGLGAMVAGSVHPLAAGGAAAALAALALGACLLTDQPWWHAVAVGAAALVGGGAVVLRAVRRLGGVTGDVLGATVEVALATALTVAALVTT